MRYASLILALVALSPAHAQRFSAAIRQQDLDFVAGQIPKLHVSFFFQLDPNDFHQAASQLLAQMPGLTDAEFYVGLAKLIAMAGDPHTHLYFGDNAAAAAGFQQFPIVFHWLDDGVFVSGAAAQYSQALGTQLIRIGDSPVEDVMEKLAAVIPHANTQWVRSYSEQDLRVQQILQGLDILPAGPESSLTFRDRAGQEFTLQVGTEAAPIATLPDARQGPLPLYLQRATENYWYTYSAPLRLLYVKYNQCADAPGYPFTMFADQVLAAFDANPVDTFVLDFRGNGGGSGALATPLFDGLNQRMATILANPNFRFYDAIDKGTFSAAANDAMIMKAQSIVLAAMFPSLETDKLVTVIGEPTGGAPGGFGNVLPFTLPGSKLGGQYSTSFGPPPPYIQPGPSFSPDVAVSVRSSDYFARHDPVMAAIVARWPGPPPPPSGDVIAVNGATLRVEQGLAPGSLATAFGAFSVVPDQVLVSGADARIVSAAAAQVNFVVPAAAQMGSAAVSIRAGGMETARGQVTITAAGPGIFVLNAADGSQPGEVENQDHTINSSSTPAGAGSIIEIFATGHAPLDASGGAPVAVMIGDTPAQVLYSAPVAQYPGLWQINAQLPASMHGQVPLYLVAGNVASNGVTLWVQ